LRVSDANAEEAVEVKELRRGQRVDVVLVVEGVEDFNAWDQLPLVVVEADGTCDAKVGDEEFVVLAEMVATAVDTVDEAGLRVVNAARCPGAVTVDVVGNW